MVSGSLQQRLLEDVLDMIKPIIMQLKSEGMKITIQSYFFEAPTNHYPDDVMPYYEHSREEWEELVAQHKARLVRLIFFSPCIHSRVETRVL